ncbi:MaoC family dehydratase [Haladaptatus sp. DFWS20]|uniref:MaoC family dehydratase n=1 Tax=Haladaptatus sp. DFWS20 TaxID=3403467 RepID=UPI003EBBFFF8
MLYEELSPGDELPPRTVEDLLGSDMKLLAAILQDPYPPHYDARRAEEMDYPGLLNQGPANLSYLLQSIVPILDSPSDLRSFDVRFQDMVFEDETVTTAATVADKWIENSDGHVEFEVELCREDDVIVGGTVTARVPRK